MSLTRAATPQSSIWKRYNSQKYLRQTNDFKPFDVLGFDQDLDCFDLNARDDTSGEYTIRTWCPPRQLHPEACQDFAQYMVRNIQGWALNAPAGVRAAVLALLLG